MTALPTRFVELCAEHAVPAAAAAVLVRGQAPLLMTAGTVSVEDSTPVTADTVFRLGSTTKLLTALVAGQAVLDGLLDLEAPVASVLPGFRLSDADATRDCTVRHLLTHTSGLPSATDHHGSRDAAGLERYVREVVPDFPLWARPGRGFRYSNIGFAVVGRLLECVLGQSYADAVTDRVFAPLGMASSTFDPLVAATRAMTQSHLDSGGELRVQRPVAEHTGLRPSGFAFSTLSDMVTFADACIGGRPDVLSPELLELVSTGMVRAPVGPGAGYGLGTVLGVRGGRRLVGHDGMISSFLCHFETLPDGAAAVVLLTNRAGASEPLLKAFEEALEDLLPSASPIAPDMDGPDEWAGFAGSYRSAELGALTVTVTEDGLAIEFGGQSQPVTQLAAGFYVADDVALAFPGPAPDHCHVNGEPLLRSTGDEAVSAAPPADLLVGSYTNEEWGVVVHVHEVADGLEVAMDGEPGRHRLGHVDGPRYVSPDGPLAFRLPASGGPAEAIIASGGLVLERAAS